MGLARYFLASALSILLSGCGGGSSGGGQSETVNLVTPSVNEDASSDSQSEPDQVTDEPVAEDFDSLVAADKQLWTEIASTSLDADGEGKGLSAYELIRDFGGTNPIESPDLYAVNHPGDPHIYEDLDPEIGEHFVFVIHRDLDSDRDRTEITDRQRNEIKTYGSSDDDVKGFEGETMIFSWKFRINSEMEVSRNFSHFFQLKAVGGEDSHPVLTITGNEQSSSDGMEVRHSPLQEDTDLARVAWSEFAGEWVQVYCRATFSNSGSLRLIASRISDGEILFDIDENDIDMWRGESDDHFVRPKWGIYRSLLDSDNLREDEEDVRFANFKVEKVALAGS